MATTNGTFQGIAYQPQEEKIYVSYKHMPTEASLWKQINRMLICLTCSMMTAGR